MSDLCGSCGASLLATGSVGADGVASSFPEMVRTTDAVVIEGDDAGAAAGETDGCVA